MRKPRTCIAAAAVAAVLALGLLAGCSDDESDDCGGDTLSLAAAERPGPRPKPAPKAPTKPKPKTGKHQVHVDHHDCD